MMPYGRNLESKYNDFFCTISETDQASRNRGHGEKDVYLKMQLRQYRIIETAAHSGLFSDIQVQKVLKSVRIYPEGTAGAPFCPSLTKTFPVRSCPIARCCLKGKKANLPGPNPACGFTPAASGMARELLVL